VARSALTVARCEPTNSGLTKFMPNGELWFSTPVQTVITTKEVPVKALGTTTLLSAVDFDMPANNRLRYLGTVPRMFFVTAAITAIAAANNKLLGFHVAKNGTVLDEAHLDRFVATGADQGAITTQVLVNLSYGDYVETWVENETDTTDLTIEHCIMICTAVG